MSVIPDDPVYVAVSVPSLIYNKLFKSAAYTFEMELINNVRLNFPIRISCAESIDQFYDFKETIHDDKWSYSSIGGCDAKSLVRICIKDCNISTSNNAVVLLGQNNNVKLGRGDNVEQLLIESMPGLISQNEIFDGTHSVLFNYNLLTKQSSYFLSFDKKINHNVNKENVLALENQIYKIIYRV